MKCPGKEGTVLQCIGTTSRNEYYSADAVTFYAHDIPPVPDLSLRPRSQVWVYVNDRLQHGILGRNEGYRNLFNWTMTPITGSDVFLGYGKSLRGKFKHGFDPNRNYLSGRSKILAVITGSCNPWRSEFVTDLSMYIETDVYEKFGRRDEVCKEDESYCHPLKRFQFFLTFQDSGCFDYPTDKLLFDGLTRGVVPVVLGGANHSAFAPPHSFIDASQFKSARELAHFLRVVGSDAAKYNAYFRWYSVYNILPAYRVCPLCVALHNPNIKPKWYEYIY